MNIDLIEDSLADAALHPERHDQRTWFCGSTMCLAAFIAQRAGWVLHAARIGPTSAWAEKDGTRISICEAARLEARLTREQAHFLFVDSASDGLKELQARWEHMKDGGTTSGHWCPPGNSPAHLPCRRNAA